MRLTPSNAKEFFAIYKPLLAYVEQRKHLSVSREGVRGPHDVYMRARDTLWDDPAQCTTFIEENPAKLSTQQLAIVQEWRDAHVRGRFVFIKSMREHKYTALMRWDPTDDRFYGVLGLTDAISRIAPRTAQFMTVLLPWNGHIIWDGLCAEGGIIIGPNMWADIMSRFRWHSARGKVVTTLAQRTTLPV